MPPAREAGHEVQTHGGEDALVCMHEVGWFIVGLFAAVVVGVDRAALRPPS